MQIPGITSQEQVRVQVRLTGFGADVAKAITVDSGNTDAGATPTNWIRPGAVLGLVTSTGRYVEANDSAGDRCTPATITSSGNTDTADGTVKLVGNHGTITVTISTGSGTEADVATDLNANAIFAAHYVATSAAGEVTIASLNVGAEEWFYIHTDTTASVGFAEGPDNGVKGADADYVVCDETVDLKDRNGVACHAYAVGFVRGVFKESNLRQLTKEARAVLIRNGSIFK